jgi:hypothetical protein
MDFAARVAMTCMYSVAKYGGYCELLSMYGGYSLVNARAYYSSDGQSGPTMTELLYDAVDGAAV